jgi:beta-galactosidase
VALACALAFSLAPADAQEQNTLPYWKDIQTVEVNKEPPRSAFMTYPDAASALTFRYENSVYYALLNGKWDFYYSESHRDLPEDITDPQADISWRTVETPGNWEIQGYGLPVYINHGYEFQPRNPQPPLLPDDVPVGVYRREITAPEGWEGRDIYLHVGGAKSGMYVYLNGQEAGYSEDSKNPAEFLLNPYLKEGKNVLMLKIYRWTTASFLECQDFWRISGIERDVFLWSQPRTAIQDFRVVSTLDDTYGDGVFGLAIDLKNRTKTTESLSVGYTLLDAQGRRVAGGEQKAFVSPYRPHTASFEATLGGVDRWSAEAPNLYTLLMEVKEAGGKVVEVVPYRVGFRRIELKGSQLLFNGQPVKFKGVNIHEHNPETGHYVTEELMRKDFTLMKLHNINAIRLSHYPQSRRFYELCDEYGFYIYEEANIESHGMYYNLRKGGTLGNNPEWLTPHLYRVANMFERNKNHPCVTFWSLGNEAGNGYNFYQAYLWLKQKDATLMKRPVNYERALWEWNTDMYVPQYPSAKWLEETGQKGSDRPVAPSEYAHAMGNSTGSLWDQWQAIYRYPNLQGGFIWEWVDHALSKTDADGRHFWAYGGDYGTNMPSDGNFVCDGLVSADRSPHPAMAEVKYAYRNIAFEPLDWTAGTFRVTNRFYFTNTRKYKVSYAVKANEKTVRNGQLHLDLAPQSVAELKAPVSGLPPKAGVDYFIHFSVTTRDPEGLLPAGYEIAHEQFRLPVATSKKTYKTAGPKLTVASTDEALTVSSSKITFSFDKQRGMVSTYKVDGVDYFAGGFGLQPNFWRAPTDNDYGNGSPKRWQVWKQSSKEFRITEATVGLDGEKALLSVCYQLPAGNQYYLNYTVYPGGMVAVHARFTAAEAAEAPRIGVRFRLPAAMHEVAYFGRGPQENYSDRKAGTFVDLYRTTAEELYFPYARPQENGHHTDTRRLTLSAATKGTGLLIESDSLFEFNALRNSVEDFDSEEAVHLPYQWTNFSAAETAAHDDAQAKNVLRRHHHLNDVSPRDFVEVCLDCRQQGVGGYDSWGALPDPPYRIATDREYQWGFIMKPIE